MTYGKQTDSGLNIPGAATSDCSNLLALAIMLLEIKSGERIEDIRCPDELGTKTIADDMTDLLTAHRWLKEEKSRGRLSHAFSQAILTCLQEYINPDANFHNSEYCKVLEEKILRPFEEEMHYLLYGPPKEPKKS